MGETIHRSTSEKVHQVTIGGGGGGGLSEQVHAWERPAELFSSPFEVHMQRFGNPWRDWQAALPKPGSIGEADSPGSIPRSIGSLHPLNKSSAQIECLADG